MKTPWQAQAKKKGYISNTLNSDNTRYPLIRAMIKGIKIKISIQESSFYRLLRPRNLIFLHFSLARLIADLTFFNKKTQNRQKIMNNISMVRFIITRLLYLVNIKIIRFFRKIAFFSSFFLFESNFSSKLTPIALKKFKNPRIPIQHLRIFIHHLII